MNGGLPSRRKGGAQVLSTQHTFHLAFAISVTQKQLLLCFYNVRKEETGADVMCDGLSASNLVYFK